MDRAVLGGVVAVGIVVVVGVLARRSGGGDTPNPVRSDFGAGAAPDAELDSPDAAAYGPDDPDSVEVVAVTSDGYALVPDSHAVRLMPPHEDGEGSA